MPQFTIYRNKNPQTVSAVPFLLDVQNDLLSDLETRVVVPLSPESAMKGKTLKPLMPVLEIEGERFVMLTPQMAGIPQERARSPGHQDRPVPFRDHRRHRFPPDRHLS